MPKSKATKKRTVVLSLGGSLIAPKDIDIKFLRQFKQLITDFTDAGNRAILITGGGDTARRYQGALRQLTKPAVADDLDWVGIAATRINAELVRSLFGKRAYKDVLGDPEVHVATTKKILVGAGWEPGFSSDVDAVLLAATYRADTVINLTNVDYVYDKDPRKHKDAQKIERITWADFQKIVGTKWVPGANHPFDPIATKRARQLNLNLVIARGSNIPNLRKILRDEEFRGTVVG